MKALDFYLDLGSPEAYLVFEHLPQALHGLSYQVRYLPVCAAELSGAWSPCDAAGFQRLHEQAQAWGVPLQRPATLDFDACPLLELVWAGARHGAPNRYQTETVLRHIWCSDQHPCDPQHLQALARQLLLELPAPGGPGASGRQHAIAWARQAGVGPLPAWVLDGRVFHGMQDWPALCRQLGVALA